LSARCRHPSGSPARTGGWRSPWRSTLAPGRLRLDGQWQLARQTHVSADLGNVTIDLTEAEFDEYLTDLHVYSGWGSITIIVPRGAEVQITQHRGGVDMRLEPPVPGLPLIRLLSMAHIDRAAPRHSASTNPGAPAAVAITAVAACAFARLWFALPLARRDRDDHDDRARPGTPPRPR